MAGQSHRAMMLRLAVDMGLFDALAKRAGVADVAQLAEDIAADELLVCTSSFFRDD